MSFSKAILALLLLCGAAYGQESLDPVSADSVTIKRRLTDAEEKAAVTYDPENYVKYRAAYLKRLLNLPGLSPSRIYTNRQGEVRVTPRYVIEQEQKKLKDAESYVRWAEKVRVTATNEVSATNIVWDAVMEEKEAEVIRR